MAIQAYVFVYVTPGKVLFEIVSRRYEQKSTLITTHRPFAAGLRQSQR